MNTIRLSQIPRHKKFQLADVGGYKVKEINNRGKCVIIGADNYIDNEFRDIDELLLLISPDLQRKGYRIAR